LTIFSANHYYY